jgi:hypothetical protein
MSLVKCVISANQKSAFISSLWNLNLESEPVTMFFSTNNFWWGPSFLVVCVVLLCVFMFWVPCSDVRYDFRTKRCSVRLLLQLFVGGLVFYLRFCVSLRIVVSNTYYVVFLFCSSPCVPMLPVSLDYLFLITPSVFSNAYLNVL